MKITLTNIEDTIEPDILNIASDLLETNAISAIEEIEKNLWQAKFVEDIEYYTEVQLVGGRLKASTCDCALHAEYSHCTHVIALLFHIRNVKTQKRNTKESIDSKRAISSKINIAQILKEVSEKELKDFVRKYAREDRNFGLAFKTQFTHLLDLQNNLEKYLLLIKNIIKNNTLRRGQINQRGANQIDKNIKQMLNQAESAILTNDYSDTFNIIKSILISISNLQSKHIDTREIHSTSLLIAFKLIDQLITRSLAPALKEDIWKFGIDECLHSKYHYQNLFLNYYQFLKKIAENNKAKLEQLLGKIEQHLIIRSLNAQAIGHLVSIQAELLEQLDREGEIVLLMKKWLKEPEVQLLAIEYLMNKEEWFSCLLILKQALKADDVLEPTLLLKFEQCNLEVARKLRKRAEIITYSKSCYLKLYKRRYFDIYKEQYDDNDWSAAFFILIAQLKQQNYSLDKARLICSLLKEEAELPALLEYLQKIKSITLLQEFDKDLFTKYNSELSVLYKEALRDFLDNYFGNENAQRVKNLLIHLEQIGERNLSITLLDMINKEYGQRRSLIAVL